MDARRRRLLAGLGALPLVAACAPKSAVMQIIDSYSALSRAQKNYPATRAAIDAQPKAVLGVQVENGTKGLLLLAKREGGLDYWQSDNGVVVVLQGARLIRTTGFPEDQLGSALVGGQDPFLMPASGPLPRDQRFESHRIVDLAPTSYGLDAVLSVNYRETQEIDVLGERYAVDVWRETVRLPQQRRKVRQDWYLDTHTGAVRRSIQQVGTESRLIIEPLKALS